jgi:glycogen synthase kinase 3 beta
MTEKYFTPNHTAEFSLGFWFSPSTEPHPKGYDHFIIAVSRNDDISKEFNVVISYDTNGINLAVGNIENHYTIEWKMIPSRWYYLYYTEDGKEFSFYIYDLSDNGLGLGGGPLEYEPDPNHTLRVYIGGARTDMYYACGTIMALEVAPVYQVRDPDTDNLLDSRYSLSGFSPFFLDGLASYFSSILAHIGDAERWMQKTCLEYPLGIVNSVHSICPETYEDFIHNRTHIETVRINRTKTWSVIKERFIAEGGGGKVYQARILETGETVAFKVQDYRAGKVPEEIEIMIGLEKHPNVIQVKAIYDAPKVVGAERDYMNLVLEYFPHDMADITHKWKYDRGAPPRLSRKIFTYQMFRAIAFLHGKGIIHRDIKPANFLVDEGLNRVKICDFGLAEKIGTNESEYEGPHKVWNAGTPRYRAPEMLLASEYYWFPTDVWAVACVFASFYNKGRHPVEGKVNPDIMKTLMELLGAPTEEDYKAMRVEDQNFTNVTATKTWKEALKHPIEDDALDLMKKIWVYNPHKRITALEAMAHPYFDDLRMKETYKEKMVIPDFFDWTEEEFAANPEAYRKLTPSWYRFKVPAVKK